MLITSCSKSTETLEIFSDVTIETSFDTNNNILSVTFSETSEVMGVQFEVVDNNDTQINILSFSEHSNYNLYGNTCYSNADGSNIGLCIVDSSDLTNPISSTNFTIEISIDETDSASLSNIVLTDKDSEIATISTSN